jgi:hypothetical protein
MDHDQSTYCAMVHGGLNLNLKDNSPWIQSCCLRQDKFEIEIGKPIWYLLEDSSLRQKNLSKQWDTGCHNCKSLETLGMPSFRTGMNDGLELKGQTALSGPARIDIMFDISCNLACRTCGTSSSTMWQKQLKSIGEWNQPIFSPRNKHDIMRALAGLDLTNLRQVVFCGGETLLGQEYWDVSKWLVDNVPDAKNNLTLCFQTNGTQSIHPRNFAIIDACKLCKLHVSIDGVDKQFEYLRWPASWQQTRDNLFRLRDTLPSNVMFLIEHTISIFNVLYMPQVEQWVEQQFKTNREGDVTNYTCHLAMGTFSLDNCSNELVDELKRYPQASFIKPNWHENTDSIRKMIAEIKKFDQQRSESFEQTFPETFECFKRFW